MREVGVRCVGSPGSIFLSGYCCLEDCCIVQSRKGERPWVKGKNARGSLEDGMRERMMDDGWQMETTPEATAAQGPKQRCCGTGQGTWMTWPKWGARGVTLPNSWGAGPLDRWVAGSLGALGQPAEPQAKSLCLPSLFRQQSSFMPNSKSWGFCSRICPQRASSRACLHSSGP